MDIIKSIEYRNSGEVIGYVINIAKVLSGGSIISDRRYQKVCISKDDLDNLIETGVLKVLDYKTIVMDDLVVLDGVYYSKLMGVSEEELLGMKNTVSNLDIEGRFIKGEDNMWFSREYGFRAKEDLNADNIFKDEISA